MPQFSLNYKKANDRILKKVWLSVALICTIQITVLGQSARERWVDSVFQTLSFEAKIGQLIMMPANAYAEAGERNRLENLITNYGIGGIVLTKGGPVSVSQLTSQLQSISTVPMLIGLNAEEGLGSTLDSTMIFPQTLMLGAVRNDSMLYYLGQEVGRQMKELGVHITFAPSADLSVTFRSDDLVSHTFGDNPERVARAGVMYMKGLQQAGVIPVVKHYPSYGLRVKEYYKGAPIMTLIQDDKTMLYPLQQLFENGCLAVLTSYQHDPIFPDRRKFAPKQKKKIVPAALPTLYTADFLKKDLNFKGLVFSYVPDVKLVLRKYQPGDSEIYAFLAGNDVLMFPENIPATIRKLRRQIKKNNALATQLNQRVKKVLSFKYDAGLNKKKPEQTTDQLFQQINTPDARILRYTLYEQAVSVVKDNTELLPVKILENKTFASLTIGEHHENEFNHYLSKYAHFDHYKLHYTGEDTTQLIQELKKYSVVVAGIFLPSAGVEKEYPALLEILSRHTNVIVCNFGPVSKISLLENPQAIVQAYIDDALMRRTVPQILFGGLPGSGRLPLTINAAILEGDGKQTPSLGRLSYAFPETAGISTTMLERIDAIAREAIDSKATPGCQVVVVKNGKVVYDRTFGWQTYDNQVLVNSETIYDLASVTKVLATLQSVMFLHDKGLIDVNKKVSVYLPELRKTNKKDIILKDVLTHQAGLVPFVPLWPQTMKNEKEFLPQFYSRIRSNQYPFQVAPDLFASPALKDSLWKWTFNSKMLEKPPRTPYTLRYSDISFWILHRLSEKLVNQPLEDFLYQNLYEPLGATTTGYLPLNRFNAERIAPTEFDNIFRKSMIVGTVHDERAAMMGGVAGHAGLFSNAHDLAKIGQMLLQNGYYGGLQYFKPETIQLFTRKQFENSRRGLGWDKPIQSDWASPTSLFASPNTFGHTGFTGTCIWIDPEFELVYIFLSNRVYPDRNTKLNTSNIRSRIQDVIYQSIFDYCQHQTPLIWSTLK